MKRLSDSRGMSAASLLALAMLLVQPAQAQEVAPPATPNADRLAEEIRTLARDPRNVRALLSAGEASARLADPSAAAGFFARAQALDPGNPRVRAGQAMVMVRMERPGEALRLFDAAARAGLNLEAYASDRGLAYDLIGAQAHAQREHRVAMRLNPDDETRRRYALSLGISGDAAQASTILEPLLRRSDRAAWRARAFILAMAGDAAGADKIAASMMGGFGTALSPFFRRLPALPAADKAFAVHFGEIRRTPARIADATAAPPLPVLRAEPGVALAAAQPVRVPQPGAQTLRNDRRGARTSAARPSRRQREAEQRMQQQREALAAQQRETERLAAQQAARDAEARRVAEAQRLVEAQRAAEAQRLAEARRAAESQQLAEAQRVAEAQRLAEAQRAAEVQRLAEAQRLTEAQQSAEAERLAQARRLAEAAPGPAAPTAVQPVTPAVAAVVAPPPAAPTDLAAAPPQVGREDNVLARIIAGITIPASELGVDPMPGEQRAAEVAAQPNEPAPAPVVAARPTPTPTQPVRVAAREPAPVAKPPAPRPADIKAKATADKAAAAKTKAAEEKATAAKAKAAEEKAAAAKARSEPARVWVQVAGGANVSDLPKAWSALVAKAPAEFRGKQAWTTPLRFTNRLLAGPFKNGDEAQSFVNAIGKKGLSAFAWTSEQGQKIAKLAAK